MKKKEFCTIIDDVLDRSCKKKQQNNLSKVVDARVLLALGLIHCEGSYEETNDAMLYLQRMVKTSAVVVSDNVDITLEVVVWLAAVGEL